MHQANDSALKDQTTMVKIIYALYLASLVAGVTSIIGVILAHVYHGNAQKCNAATFNTSTGHSGWVCCMG